MLTIIGITRFSLVTNSTLGDFVATRGGSRADAEAAVFASPRMKSRFQLFGALTLPSMAALARQSDNFHYLLMISSRLPLRWKLKLKTYVWRYPWCRIIELQPEEHLAQRARIEAGSIANGSPMFTFRIDDDDALSTEYLDSVIAASTHGAIALSFERGIALHMKGAASFATIITPKTPAVGLGYFSAGKTIHDLGNHTKIAERGVELVVLDDRPYWLKSVHSNNDQKRAEEPPIDQRLSAAALDALMRQQFRCIDFSHIPYLMQ